jgi:hypothetical protein
MPADLAAPAIDAIRRLLAPSDQPRGTPDEAPSTAARSATCF